MICVSLMNKCSVVVLMLLVFLGVSTMNAQPLPERPPMPSPEEIAQRKTEKMDQEISLDVNIDAIGKDCNLRFIYDKEHLHKYKASFDPTRYIYWH